LLLLSSCYLHILKQTPLKSTPQLVDATSVKVPDATTIINRGKRPSKIQLGATLRKIRHLLAEGHTNKEIIELLQVEERTFYRYMARI
jgi:DNA-binding NarL/FixJ family response regulator